ncbi:uncharacterized protein METZ01_LOCUS263839, partial [marine metagenome]
TATYNPSTGVITATGFSGAGTFSTVAASGALTATGVVTVNTGIIPDGPNGAYLGTSSAEFSGLALADGSQIRLGHDQDVTLTHVADTGVLLNTTSELQFRDSALKINSSADSQLDIDADSEVEITTTTVDLNGALDVSGTSILAGVVTANAGIIPDAADGAYLGTTAAEFSDLFLADGSVINLGNEQDVTVTHDADDGLELKSAATADDNPFLLTIQSGEIDIAAADVLGTLNFQAPDEETGTDAILVAAGIEAVSEGDFSSSSNATKLSFKTASSEAATEKMSLSSVGNLTVSGDITISGDDLTMGTNTSGAALIGDGTNYNPVVISGDISIGQNGAAAISSGVV